MIQTLKTNMTDNIINKRFAEMWQQAGNMTTEEDEAIAILQFMQRYGELIVRELKDGTFEVIDGGHRCRAIVEFVSNQFRLEDGFTVTLTDGTQENVGGLYFKELPQYLQEFFFS